MVSVNAYTVTVFMYVTHWSTPSPDVQYSKAGLIVNIFRYSCGHCAKSKINISASFLRLPAVKLPLIVFSVCWIDRGAYYLG